MSYREPAPDESTRLKAWDSTIREAEAYYRKAVDAEGERRQYFLQQAMNILDGVRYRQLGPVNGHKFPHPLDRGRVGPSASREKFLLPIRIKVPGSHGDSTGQNSNPRPSRDPDTR